VTLAYAAINVGMFIAWWNKPRNVDRPIRVFQKPMEKDSPQLVKRWVRVFFVIAGMQDWWCELHEMTKVPMFYSGRPGGNEGSIADLITLAAGVVFGAIHCIAWSFDFGSRTELLLWRLSSIAITVVPALFVLAFGIGLIAHKGFLKNIFVFVLGVLVIFVLPFSALLYVAARLTTVILAFTNLASLPPGAYQTVHWTTLIPHL
jgi:hypothetical protein